MNCFRTVWGLVCSVFLVSCVTKTPVPELFTANPATPEFGIQVSDVVSSLPDEGVGNDGGIDASERAETRESYHINWRQSCGDGILERGEFCFEGHQRPIEFEGMDDVRSLSLGDWNGDGLSDLLVTRVSSRKFQILGSTIDEPFSTILFEEVMPGETEPYSAFFLDLNEDGRLDIVVSGTGMELIAYKGDGEGQAYDFWITPFAMSWANTRWRWVEMRDANNDGLVDIIGYRDVYDNSKWGQIIVSLQNEMESFNSPIIIGTGRGASFVDLDFDGDLDVITQEKTGKFTQLYFNEFIVGEWSPDIVAVDGPTETAGGPVPWSQSPEGTMEFLVGTKDEIRVVEYDLAHDSFDVSTLATAESLRIDPWNPQSVDLDLDGNPEILWSMTSGLRFGVMNPEDESPIEDMLFGDAGPSRERYTLGDADGDGLPEALFYSAQEEALRIVDLDSEGMKADTVGVLLSNMSADQIMSGDFNGDGFADLAGVRKDKPPVVLLSDGVGGVSEQLEIPLDGLGATGISLGDTNDDGRDELLIVGTQKLIVCGLDSNNELWHTSTFLSHGVYAVAVASNPDVNGDQIPDLFVTASNRKVHMYLGNGDGTFEHHWTGVHDGDEASVRAGDFDGDGYSGVVVFGRYPKTLTRAFHNTAGKLSTIPFTLSLTERHVEVGDIDGDGRDDIVSGGGGGGAQLAYSVSGNGFVVVERDGDPKDEQTGIAVADIDGYKGAEIIVPDGGDIVVLKGDSDLEMLLLNPPVEVARFSKRGVQRRLIPADVNGDGFIDLWSLRSGTLVNNFINNP